jgi:uncharacterized protein YoxC
MKKIIIFYIIFSFIFLSFRSFVFAQDQQDQNIQEIKLDRLDGGNCKLPSSIEETEEEEATSSYEYVNPMEAFSGEGVQENPSWKDELVDFVKGLVKGLIADFFAGLLGKVPTVAGQTDNAIAQSIKESIKNTVGSIRAAIALSLKDSQYYLQYRIWSEISNKLQGLVSKNIIPDLTTYKDLRIFLAYLRIVSDVIDNYKSKNGCIDPKLKSCVDGLVLSLKLNAENLSNKNPKLEVWVKKVYDQIDRKVAGLYCQQEQGTNISGIIKPTNIAIKPNKVNVQDNKISFYIKDNYIKANIGSIDQPVYFSILDKNGNEIQRIYVDPKNGQEANLWNINELANQIIKNYNENYNLKIKTCVSNKCKLNNLNIGLNVYQPTRFSLASIFNPFKKVLSLKNLFSKIPFLAQTYYTGEETYNTGNYPIPNVLETEDYLNSCAVLGSEINLDITTRLQKEIDKINTILASSGGFKEQTKCLVTWEEKDQDLANQGKISGDDPRCKIPGPTLTYPDVYKKIQEQVVSGELDILKNKEQTTNLMVSFIRSWLDSKLFKIIDKGFASLEARFSGESYAADIVNAYSPDKIKEICERAQSSTDIQGLSENCRATLQSQAVLITKSLQNEFGAGYAKRIGNILNYIATISATIDEYISTLSSDLDLASSTLQSNNIQSDEINQKINKLNDILLDLQNKKQTLASTTDEINSIEGVGNIFQEFASKTQEIASSATATALASTTQKIKELEDEIATTTRRVEEKLYDLSNKISKTQKISQAFSGDIAKISIMQELPDGSFQPSVSSDSLNPDYIIEKGTTKKLSFYKFFYPNYIDKLSSQSLTDRYQSQNQCVKRQWLYYTYYSCPDLLIAYDLSRIYNIFFGKPQSSVSEQSFMEAFQSHINDVLQGVATPTPNDYTYLYNFLKKTEVVVNAISSAGKNYQDTIFQVQAGSPYPQNYLFTIGDAIDFLNNDFIPDMEGILEILKDYDQAQKMQELKQLKDQAKKYQDEIDKEYDEAWKSILSQLTPDKLNSLYSTLESNKDKIQGIAEDVYNKCGETNELIEDLETEINMSLYAKPGGEVEQAPEEEQGTPPPQTRGIIKTIFASIKNFIGNIFRIFIKPKGIYLK